MRSLRGTRTVNDPEKAQAEVQEHRVLMADLEDEFATLRRRLQDAPKRVRTLEERLLETTGQLAQAVSHN